MNQQKLERLRVKLFDIIFEADTPEGRAFDVALLWTIVASVVLVTLESVDEIRQAMGLFFYVAEWIITVLFTVEYVLRIWLIKQRWKFVFSFYGLVDLLSILPTYLGLLFLNTHYLITIRALRLLRVFRVLRMGHYVREGQFIQRALIASRRKILVFVMTVGAVVIISGSAMYVIEGTAGSGFDNIPKSIYWAIVTVTTVGYGDISPTTPFGQFLASLLMITGYAVIAVPTGIVSAEMSSIAREMEAKTHTRTCPTCGKEGHDKDARYCKHCSHIL